MSDSEEEILVYAEVPENIMEGHQRNIHVLGLNDVNPIIQMGNNFFKGTYQIPLGTYMFFDEDLEPKCEDPLFDKLPDKNLKFVFKTTKYLHLEHAHVMPKENADVESKSQQSENEEIVEPVHFQSIPEALEKFKTDWLPELSKSIESSEGCIKE